MALDDVLLVDVLLDPVALGLGVPGNILITLIQIDRYMNHCRALYLIETNEYHNYRFPRWLHEGYYLLRLQIETLQKQFLSCHQI